jgi:SAM-dependent methyltransferase
MSQTIARSDPLSEPLSLYAAGLLSAPLADGMRVRFRDGSVRPCDLHRFIAPADAVDERVLVDLAGPVIDIGCGPGRHLHALARRGVFGHGVDLSPVAAGMARGLGANVIVASIFDELPGLDRWSSALLLDGNIGIGGAPTRLLRRIRALLARDGQVIVELSPPGTRSVRTTARLELAGAISEWFPWAEVSTDSVQAVAMTAALAVERRWSDGGRWFAALRVC